MTALHSPASPVKLIFSKSNIDIVANTPEVGEAKESLPVMYKGRLGQTLNTKFALGQETQLANAVVGQTGVVLVAWEHKAIARDLLPAITNRKSLPGMPTKWDGTRFDVVFRFDRMSPEAPWSFRQLCPCLLSGDSANPMG